MDVCKGLFQTNNRVRLYQAALGANNGTTTFSLAGVGTSEYKGSDGSAAFEARVMGVSDFLQELTRSGCISDAPGCIGCLKLNIEGGEYGVLQQLIENGELNRFRSFLIQFHCQPEGWSESYQKIIASLQVTHQQAWCYPMVWERWDMIDNSSQ